jgi:endonuclease/exonuclease/phosphatase family metal-dependent hydrolase
LKFILLITIFLKPLLSHAEDFKLLSWNVFMIPKPINFSKQATRTKMMAEKLQDNSYDVMLFQEAFLKSFRTAMAGAFRQSHPYHEYLQRSVRPTHILNSGLFVMSRHPIKVLDHFYFNQCTHSDCFAAKGVLLFEVSLPSGKSIQLAVSHTQAWEDQKAKSVRATQMQEIYDLLKKHQRPLVPQILAGDLNMDALKDPEYQKTLKLFEMVDHPLTGNLTATSGFPITCYKKPGKSEEMTWLDHIWLAPHGSEANFIDKKALNFTGLFFGIECPLSDHYAVEATIKL